MTQSPTVAFPTAQRFGTFLARLNRFAALVELDSEQAVAHLPNTGRMTELLVPGQPVMVIERPAITRKTAYDLLLIEYEGRWVSVDARLPSQLLYKALLAGVLPVWAGCNRVRREAVYGESRLDLELWRPSTGSGNDIRCLIETKSCNLVVDGRALFPDAPTLRGTKHLHSLMHAAAEGLEAAAVFVIQRPDATVFSPFDEADPLFGRTLREAAKAGVGVHAFRCDVNPIGMTLLDAVPVYLP